MTSNISNKSNLINTSNISNASNLSNISDTSAFFCFDPEDFQRIKEIESLWINEIPPKTSLDAFQTAREEDINPLLDETNITIVFIGKHTFESEKCLRAIEESFHQGNAFLAVYLNNAEDVKKSGKELLGKNPFEQFYFEYKEGKTEFYTGSIPLPGMLKRRFISKEIKSKADFVKIYDYIKDDGAANLNKWIEEERRKKADFFTECDKIKEAEWEKALKITFKGGMVGHFLYYHWLTYSKKKEE